MILRDIVGVKTKQEIIEQMIKECSNVLEACKCASDTKSTNLKFKSDTERIDIADEIKDHVEHRLEQIDAVVQDLIILARSQDKTYEEFLDIEFNYDYKEVK